MLNATVFFNLGWWLQLLSGLLLFGISLSIEAQMLSIFMQSTLLGWLLASALETGKVLAIIWYRYLRVAAGGQALGARLLGIAFRLSLLVLSAICTLLFLATALDRPQLESAMQADQLQLAEQHSKETRQRDSRYQADRERLLLQYRTTLEQIGTARNGNIDTLRERLKLEMDNVVNGEFKGPRYREIERLLNSATGDRDQITDTLKREHLAALATLDNRQQRLIEREHARHQQQRSALATRNYSNDERANDPRVVGFLRLCAVVLSEAVEPLVFAFWFSLLLAVLIELGTWLAFESASVALLGEATLQRQSRLDRRELHDSLRRNMAASTEKNIDLMDQIDQRAQDTINAAEQHHRQASKAAFASKRNAA